MRVPLRPVERRLVLLAGDALTVFVATLLALWTCCYLVNAANIARADGAVWVLSAGPNGVIDTPFDTSLGHALAGDDIGALVR